jgi:hypothetical protein
MNVKPIRQKVAQKYWVWGFKVVRYIISWRLGEVNLLFFWKFIFVLISVGGNNKTLDLVFYDIIAIIYRWDEGNT